MQVPHLLTSRNTILTVSIATVVGFLIRLYYSLVLPIGWDGGIFLYWAELINNGATPYRDFFIRDPVYIYLVALAARVFGQSYLSVSLVSTIPGAATVPVVYKTARELFDRPSALVASVATAIAPTIVWYNTVFDERTLFLLLSVCALWTLAVGLRKGRLGYLFLYGLLLGVSVFEYRGIAIYLVTAPLLFAFLFLRRKGGTGRRYKRFLTMSVVMLLGAVLSAGAVFLYFSLNSSFTWMLSNFGFGGQQESASYFIYGEVAVLSFRERIFDVFVREWLYLIAPAAATVCALFLSSLRPYKRLVLGFIGTISTGFLVVSVVGLTYFPQSSYGAYEPSEIYTSFFLTSLILLTGLIASVLPGLSRDTPMASISRRGATLGVYWLASTGLLIALFGVPLVNYYDYLAPTLTILASPSIARIIADIRRNPPHRPFQLSSRTLLGIAFLLLLAINAGSTAEMLLTTQMTWRNQTVSSVQDIASYIEAHTGPQDQILAGNPAIAVFAHREEALGVTQWQIYGKTGPEPFNPMPYDPFHLFPNVTQIAQAMAQGTIKFVVADNSPPILYMLFLHPTLESAFRANFVLNTTIDGIPIYGYDPIWDLSQHLADVTAFSNSTSYFFTNGSWTDGFNHVLISSAQTVALPTVGGISRPDQVEFLPPFISGESFIQVTLPGNIYSNLTTSYALGDTALGNSEVTNYTLSVYVGNQLLKTVSYMVTTNMWQQSTIPLPVAADNITIVLSSTGRPSPFNLLQTTLTLTR